MAQDQVHLLVRGEFKIDKLIQLGREFSQVIMVIEQNPIEVSQQVIGEYVWTVGDIHKIITNCVF